MFEGIDKAARITFRRPAGSGHRVLTIEGGGDSFRREPCAQCPWRKDAVGVFPTEAFRHSGETGTKVGQAGEPRMFACHANGSEKPAACAGYILASRDTIGWQAAVRTRRFDPAKVHSAGLDLFPGYFEMAVANGVAPDDPAIAGCRPRDSLDTAVQALHVAPVDLIHWAGRIRPYIAKMAEGSGGRYLAQDLFAALAAGRMLLWIAVAGPDVKCVLISEIHNFPQMRVMRMIGLVGHQPWRWKHLLALVETKARTDFGCSIMESLHRPRFFALLRGYLTTHWLSEKAIR